MGKTKLTERSKLAQNIVLRRKELSWSQDDLAAKSGVPLNTIKLIETGKRVGGLDTIGAIAGALGCGIDELKGEPPVFTMNKVMRDPAAIIKMLEKLQPAHEELQQLKEENAKLNIEIREQRVCINSLPKELFSAWAKAEGLSRAMALFVLTGEPRHLDRLDQEGQRTAEKLFGFLGLQRSKPPASG